MFIISIVTNISRPAGRAHLDALVTVGWPWGEEGGRQVAAGLAPSTESCDRMGQGGPRCLGQALEAMGCSGGAGGVIMR